MQLLYPSHPLRSRQPDDQYGAEVEAIRSVGFEVSFFSFEEFQTGDFRPRPVLRPGATVLYRGWMMSGSEYESFAANVIRGGARLFTSTEDYLNSHHLPNWYPLIRELTPETFIFPPDCDLESELRALAWPDYFIKDYVKSVKTAGGSRISKPEQITAVIAEMHRFRGMIEGGFCIRRVEDFLPETECRYFVLNGTPYGPNGEVPSIVHECAKRLSAKFFSVDVIQRRDGQLRVVEVGDGQVSDLVGWQPEAFARMLGGYFGAESMK